MKKLTILVALLLCVTIGGVYAAWVYPGQSLGSLADVPAAKEMVDATFEGASGAYSIESNTMHIAIDDTNGDHEAELVFTGALVIKFTADDHIDPADLQKALSAVITVTGVNLDAAVYGEEDIFTLDSTYKLVLDPENDWQADGNVYTYTYAASNLAGAISIGEFTLHTYTEYKAFSAEQVKATFKVQVNPGA